MILRWLAWRCASELALLIARSMRVEPDAWRQCGGGWYRNEAPSLEVIASGRVFESVFPSSIGREEPATSWADRRVLRESLRAMVAEKERRKSDAVRARITTALTATGSA